MNTIKASSVKKHLLVLLMVCSTGSFAALNKWVDEKGKVHYSDQPPPANVKAQQLRPTVTADDPANTGDTAAASAPAAPKTIAEREAELKKEQQAKQAAAEKAAQEQARAEARKADCEAAQQSLKTLQSDLRIIEMDAKGEQAYLTDEQRRQRIEKAQQSVDTYCD